MVKTIEFSYSKMNGELNRKIQHLGAQYNVRKVALIGTIFLESRTVN